MKLIDSKFIYTLFVGGLLTSCATEKAQYGKDARNYTSQQRINSKNIAHTFYLIGDAGNAEQPHAQAILQQFKKRLDSADKNSTIIFLGDNIYPSGMPDSTHVERKNAEQKLDLQLDLARNFKGDYFFIPGNHDWYSKGIKGLKAQQEYLVNKTNNKKIFAPKNSCGIETRKIGKDLALIIVDSEWFLADWDQNPGVNKNCDIKTREDFFTELEDQLNKNQNKTIVLAIHHPLIDNGSHGGKYSIKKQLFPFQSNIPLPGLASLINISRTTGGMSHQDLSNASYLKLSKRIQTLLADKDNVIVVSGHDHNLQYLEKGSIKQIISGAGSKHEAAAAIRPADFSYGSNGYTVLEITQEGEAQVSYYGRNNDQEELLYSKKILNKRTYDLPKSFEPIPATKKASIYTTEQTKKSSFYKWLWGNNYRPVYSTKVNVPTLNIQELFGGAKPTRTGGGHQTSSLRLETPKGEYVIRGLKKSGVRFLQSVAFKDRYVVNEFENRFADQFLMDFYTSSHPYTPLAVSQLSEKVGLKHTRPQLFYIPKQAGLQQFNENFGDGLYYLEIRPGETEDSKNPTYSTEEIFQFLAKDEKYQIDERLYIRARLFDMLIGDWDRHHDQWKWESYEKEGKIYFTPFPKDRDQAFVKYDGWVTQLILDYPELKHMQSFGAKIKNVKWFNREPYSLDLAFTRQSHVEDWLEEAQFIAEQLTENDIKAAFKTLPEEVQNRDIDEIIRNLEVRKQDLKTYAQDYYKVLQKYVVLAGTNKRERFTVTRLEKGQTSVKIDRLKKSGEETIFEKTYNDTTTKEIWLYGLDDNDEFKVVGNNNSTIKVRMLGGHAKDVYLIENSKKVKIYDYKDNNKPKLIKGEKAGGKFTDNYSLNLYDYTHPQYEYWTLNPNANYNPDDDIVLGGFITFTHHGFKKNPFSSRHTLKANYFTGNNGYQIGYKAEIPRLTGYWHFEIEGNYSSSHFIKNYFGVGNLSENHYKELDIDYYRVRAKELYFSPSLHWKKNALHFFFKPTYEGIKIDPTAGRQISEPGVIDSKLFKTQHFAGVDIGMAYENMNRSVNPSVGMRADIKYSFRQNIENSKKVPALELGLGYIHYLTTNEKLTLSSYAKVKWLFSNEYEFYQMATLGGNKDLRGFHFNRFHGKNSFYQTSDLRYDLGTISNHYIPLNVGIFAGFDYGKVWMPNTYDQKWHNSYGGGLWVNVLDLVGAQVSYFRSSDGGRFVFGFGVDF